MEKDCILYIKIQKPLYSKGKNLFIITHSQFQFSMASTSGKRKMIFYVLRIN